MVCACAMRLGTGYTQVVNRSLLAKLPERKHAAKINLLSPFYGTLNLSYQHVLNRNSSLQLTATYMDFDFYGGTTNPVDSLHGGSDLVKSQRAQGFTIVPEYRFVINGRGLSGIYLAPFIRYAYYEYSQVAIMDTSYYSSQLGYVVTSSYLKPDFYAYHTIAFGGIIGKQLLFKNKVCLDLFCGPVLSILVSSNKQIKFPADVVMGPGIPGAYLKGYGIRAGIAIGIAH